MFFGKLYGEESLSWSAWNGTVLNRLRGLDRAPVIIGALDSTRLYATNITEDLASAGTDARDAVMKMNVTATGHLPNSNETTTWTHTAWFRASRLSEASLVDPGLTVSHDADGMTFTVTATQGVSACTWLDYPAGAVVTFTDKRF